MVRRRTLPTRRKGPGFFYLFFWRGGRVLHEHRKDHRIETPATTCQPLDYVASQVTPTLVQKLDKNEIEALNAAASDKVGFF